ncbi:MAG: hypothetical protein JSR76_03595 [Verrucomicrobia bacterium]|nr:hypothetical protein [Verrucomicrobiota bacterium]
MSDYNAFSGGYREESKPAENNSHLTNLLSSIDPYKLGSSICSFLETNSLPGMAYKAPQTSQTFPLMDKTFTQEAAAKMTPPSNNNYPLPASPAPVAQRAPIPTSKPATYYEKEAPFTYQKTYARPPANLYAYEYLMPLLPELYDLFLYMKELIEMLYLPDLRDEDFAYLFNELSITLESLGAFARRS